MIVLEVDFKWFSMGAAGVFVSFFSTICGRLENGKWGSKYPYLMNKLYNGELPLEDVKYAREELLEVQEAMKTMPISLAIWDIDNPEERHPWADEVGIDNLYDFFATDDHKRMISVMFEAFDWAEDLKQNVKARETATIPNLTIIRLVP